MTGVDCIKPWGLDRATMEMKIGADLTTQSGINALKEKLLTPEGLAELTVVFSADVNADKGATSPDGKFQALTDQGSSSERWERLMASDGCGNSSSEFSTANINAQPGEGNQIVGRSDAIVRQTNTDKGPCKKGLVRLHRGHQGCAVEAIDGSMPVAHDSGPTGYRLSSQHHRGLSCRRLRRSRSR